MTIFTALYNLLIGPLELFFELIFSFANGLVHNPGLSIIALSLVMNFLVLPLYRQADAMQEEERRTEARLKKWTDHIKKTFTGDERFMMLQTYYRQNHYKPTDALKGSVSLLLEIPFFMAAYNFLSDFDLLKGASFGPIHDLGAPDGLLVVGGLAINLLPILMTAINLISSAIYLKGLPLKSKVQLYGMALIFLVLLYQSPAGLVFYWTLNNLFSLCKNIFYKLKNPRLVLSVLVSAVSALGLVYTGILHPIPVLRTRIFLMVFLLLLQLPLIFCLLAGRVRLPKPAPLSKREQQLFYLGGLLLTLLTGLLIPSGVIKTSPQEFINRETLASPNLYVLNALLLAAGTFLVWCSVFYALASPGFKRLFSCGMWVLCGAAVIDYLFFGRDYGTLSNTLQFDLYPDFSAKSQLVNLAVLALAALVLLALWLKKKELVRAVYLAAAIAAMGMGLVNVYSIHSVASAKTQQIAAFAHQEAQISLSKTGKNVVVVMLDRAIGAYIPYIMNEDPALQQQFAGFTYYPNTISYGPYTNFGSPALYGGYDYTPEQLNQRDTEPLRDKQNEALKVMPVTFDQAGFDVTVCDPSLAGYDWIPDLSIYDDYPDIQKYITIGKYNIMGESRGQLMDHKLNRNFFCYSLFKISPVLFQPIIYNFGAYNEINYSMGQTCDSLTTGVGLKNAFMDSYGVLCQLPDLTQVNEGETGSFVMMSNDTTHEPTLLQLPAYEPAFEVNNTEYEQAHADRFTLNGRTLKMDNLDQVGHYHANMAAMRKLGQWFDQLRQLGVYDNTRIILVSDHGRNTHQLEDARFGPGEYEDALLFNALLMVKDFGSEDFVTEETFMTNGAVPALAMEGLVEAPVNPFTQKPIRKDPPAGPQNVFFSDQFNVLENNGNTFQPGTWYTVENSIFEASNWKKQGTGLLP